MKLVVGLGNPGPEYADTRHNVGVRVLERFGQRHGIALDRERFLSRFGAGRLAPDAGESERPAAAAPIDVALLAPQTFMNRSGAAVVRVLEELPLDALARDLFVVLDDVDLPFGRLRLRPSGGAGGHRGLADVIARLATRDFPRLRIGVGRPPGARATTDHVLAPFSAEERTRLPELLDRAADALELALRSGVAPAMEAFNRDPLADAGENG